MVICEGTCGAFDPNDGLVWGELVERSKEWSFWREHVERSNRWSHWSERVERSNVWSFEGGLRERLKVRSYVMPCTFGGNLWSDRKSDHYGENMRSDPTGGPNRGELME